MKYSVKSHFIVYIVMIFIVISMSSCDIFALRTPEDPEGSSKGWLQPDTPEQVIENLQTAITDLNSTNYLRSLDSAFVYEPDVNAQASDPNLWTSWNLEQEQAWFSQMAAAAQSFAERNLQFVDVTENITADMYQYQATYILTITHSRINEGIPSQWQGKLLWEIKINEDGLWNLHYWADQLVANQPSWSSLRADFVQ